MRPPLADLPARTILAYLAIVHATFFLSGLGAGLATGASALVAAAAAVSVLAMGRYAMMAAFVRALAARGGSGSSLLAGGAWLIALLALAVVLAAAGKRGGGAAAWAAAGACVGPAGLFLAAAFLGLRSATGARR
jgi:hypothetical protein